MGEEVASLTKAIKAVGDEIRMKKASGEDIGLLVDKLKDLKAKFQGVTGKPFDPPKEKEKKKKKEKQPEQAPAGGEGGEGGVMSKNEKKKAEKAAKKAAAKAAHKQAAAAGGAPRTAVAAAVAAPLPPPPPPQQAAVTTGGASIDYSSAIVGVLKAMSGGISVPAKITQPNTVARFICLNAPAGTAAAALCSSGGAADGQIDQFLSLATKQPPAVNPVELETILLGKSFLVGESLSLADVAIFTALVAASPKAVIAPSGALRRWCASVHGFLAAYAGAAGDFAGAGPHAAAPTERLLAAAQRLTLKKRARATMGGDASAAGAAGLGAKMAPVSKPAAATEGTEQPLDDVAAKRAAAKAAKDAKKAAKKNAKKDQVGAADAPPPADADGDSDVTALDIRVGVIKKAWPHPESEKLWCEEIDIGEEKGPRQIASGLRPFYANASDLEGRTVLVVANLKTAKMAGFASEGMVLCASDAAHETVKFVEVPAGSAPGERVLFEGLTGKAATPKQIEKKKIAKTIIFGGQLQTIDGGVCTYQGKIKMLLRGGPVTAPVPAGFAVA
jgi:aminoacyl tRNA synthase complex-interacting multifunctional protein 1